MNLQAVPPYVGSQKTQTDQRAIASISVWEFAMMVTKGRINVKIDPKRWLNDAIGNSGLRIIELTPEIAMESCNLPGSFHKDPADRITVTEKRVVILRTFVKKTRKTPKREIELALQRMKEFDHGKKITK